MIRGQRRGRGGEGRKKEVGNEQRLLGELIKGSKVDGKGKREGKEEDE